VRQKPVRSEPQKPGLLEVRRAADGIVKAAGALDELPYLDAATRVELKEIGEKGRRSRRAAAEYGQGRDR
jgi:hypothetical protein